MTYMDNLYAKLRVTLCYIFMVAEVGSLDTNYFKLCSKMAYGRHSSLEVILNYLL